MTDGGAPARAVSALRRFTERTRDPVAQCELCAAPLPASHAHVLDPAERALACACGPCAVLFPTSGPGRRLRVETRVGAVESALTPEELRALGIPVSLAFVVPSDVHDCTFAFYPNAQGATEGVLPRAIVPALARRAPALSELAPEVDGVFLDVEDGQVDLWRVSLDVVHRIIGRLREGKSETTSLRIRVRHVLEEVVRGARA